MPYVGQTFLNVPILKHINNKNYAYFCCWKICVAVPLESPLPPPAVYGLMQSVSEPFPYSFPTGIV